MTTRDLDRWLLNKDHYTDGYKEKVESVQPTNTSTTKSVAFIVCPTCLLKTGRQRAARQGAQDACDFYRCEAGHITVLRLNWTREEWGE